MSLDDEDFSLETIFPEPLRPPSPKPTLAVFTRKACSHDKKKPTQDAKQIALQTSDPLYLNSEIDEDLETIEIRLVGIHPLWGHYLWNAARSMASYLDEHPRLYRGHSVLELGAGGGLPGIVAAKNGARHVTLTDYPELELINNLEHNVVRGVPESKREHVNVQGYLWGHPVHPLLEPLLKYTDASDGFDLILMSDLIFNHSQHEALLKTCNMALNKQPPPPRPLSPTAQHRRVIHSDASAPCLLVFYTHHRPHLAYLDLQFFEKARAQGWHCNKIITQTFPPMFPDDPGEETVRSTVHGWCLSRIEIEEIQRTS